MTLVVFLRGVNVGRHKRFLPATLAKDLAAYDVVNVGAAGTFVVRAPVPQAALLAEIRMRLAFHADIIIVKGRELIEFAGSAPFGRRPPAANEQRFLSVMLKKPGSSRRSRSTIQRATNGRSRLSRLQASSSSASGGASRAHRSIRTRSSKDSSASRRRATGTPSRRSATSCGRERLDLGIWDLELGFSNESARRGSR